MSRNLKFSEIIPKEATVQGTNGTEHVPTGGWNEQAFGPTPPDWSPDRWARDSENGSPEIERGPGRLYRPGPPEFGFQKKP